MEEPRNPRRTSLSTPAASVTRSSWLTLCLVLLACICGSREARSDQPPTVPPDIRKWPELGRALAAQTDLWGEAALAQPGGPSYEYFAARLPPLRYVNAAFRHYPLVLSAPQNMLKARCVSNGSAINAHAKLGTWRDVGFPVTFHVGAGEQNFGADLTKLDGPRYAQGYLPIVQNTYRQGDVAFSQEVFAGVAPPWDVPAAVFVRLGISGEGKGQVSAGIGHDGAVTVAEGRLLDSQGRALVLFDASWKWEPSRKKLTAVVTSQSPAILVVLTSPLTETTPALTPALYEEQRKKCAQVWQSLLDCGMRLSVPEPVVNNAWRALILGTFMLRKQDVLCYSAGNAYERQYEAECGDALRALLLFGYADDARRMLPPLLDYQQKGLKYHDAAFKLQLLAHCYWLTRDGALLRAQRKRWQSAVDMILQGREAGTGLLPRESYCGDIHQQVYTLNSNANGWRGVRDLAAVLADIDEREQADRLRGASQEFRKAILRAVEKSERRDFKPPFIPIALFGDEKPYEVLTASMIGSYWCLMAPYLLGSEVFDPGSERETAILDTLHQRGGICMGMVRFHQHSGLFANENGLDDLYGLRYTLALLRRDEPDRALVSFYGKLAQGMTRDTFIGGEGSGLVPLDEHGRPTYLPPSSSGNAFFLWTLRHLLIQDWDTDFDGEPDELRLLFATPRHWLEDGKVIEVEHGPTAFGRMSLSLRSRLGQGEVLVEVQAPERVPRRTLLRLRLPPGWKLVSAQAGDVRIPVDDRATLDVSVLKGRFTVRCRVEKGSDR